MRLAFRIALLWLVMLATGFAADPLALVFAKYPPGQPDHAELYRRLPGAIDSLAVSLRDPRRNDPRWLVALADRIQQMIAEEKVAAFVAAQAARQRLAEQKNAQLAAERRAAPRSSHPAFGPSERALQPSAPLGRSYPLSPARLGDTPRRW